MKRIPDIKNSYYILSFDSSLEETMKAITANRKGAIIIVDDRMHLVGVVSDGDIRRAMLKGAIMQTPIKQLINYDVRFIKDTDKKTIADPADILAANTHINLFPVVDAKNVVVDVVARP